jgi:RNA polymerase primary sigma factor
LPDDLEVAPAPFDLGREPTEQTELVTDSSFSLYLRDMRHFKLLDAHEERELTQRVAEGDETAREQLLQSNLRLVISVAKRYQGHGLTLPDLVQEGFFGLRRASERFDPRRGNKFSTYATIWIKQSCQRAISQHGQTIAVPVHVDERRRALTRAATELVGSLGREPTHAELSACTGVEVEHVAEALAAPGQTWSLDQPLVDDGIGRIAFVVDHDAVDPLEAAEEARRTTAARESLQTLPELERAIVTLRHGLSGQEPLGQIEVARRLGVSRDKVRAGEQAALERLKPRLAHLLGNDPASNT